MKKKDCAVWGVLLLLTLSPLSIAYADWNVLPEEGRQYERPASDSLAVCKIGSTYYTNIGRAIENAVAGDTIEVLPGNKDRLSEAYTIRASSPTKTLTIAQGVKLNIPYALGQANTKVPEGANATHALGNRAKYCQSSVILGDGLTLINEGTIEIGGLIGAGGGGTPSGCTAGNYAELILGEGSTLVNRNRIDLYGYLGERRDQSSLLVMEPGVSGVVPSLHLPLYWHDYCGGSALKAVYDAIPSRYCIPLDDFYVENVGTKTRIYGGSSVVTWANLYAMSNNGEYDLEVIGNDASSIIQIPEGSYVETDYDEETMVNPLHFYGGANFNALKIDVKKAITDIAGAGAWFIASLMGVPEQVSSDEGYFPVSYHFPVTLDRREGQETAEYRGSNTRYKFMNGSSLHVKKGARLDCQEIVAYQGDDIYTGRAGHAASFNKSKKPLEKARMNIEGTLSAGIVAGEFDAASPGGSITASTASKVTMYEPKNGTGEKKNAKMLDGEEGWFYLPLTLKLRNASGAFEERPAGKYDCVADDRHWEGAKELIGISIREKSGIYESDKKAAHTFDIVVDFHPADYVGEIESFAWKQQRHRTNVSEDGTFENSTHSGTTFKTVKNENWLYDNEIDVWLELTVKGRAETMKSNVVTFTAKH